MYVQYFVNRKSRRQREKKTVTKLSLIQPTYFVGSLGTKLQCFFFSFFVFISELFIFLSVKIRFLVEVEDNAVYFIEKISEIITKKHQIRRISVSNIRW